MILFGQFRPQTNKQTNRFALRMHDLFELTGREPNLSSDVDQSTDGEKHWKVFVRCETQSVDSRTCLDGPRWFVSFWFWETRVF